MTSRLSQLHEPPGYDADRCARPVASLPPCSSLRWSCRRVLAAADPTPAPDASDQVLVRYRADSTPAQRRGIARDLGLTTVSTSVDGRTQVLVAADGSPATARRRLRDDPRVAAVAPNFRREVADEITAEPGFSSQWGLHNTGQTLVGTSRQTGIPDIDIDGLEALRITRGSSDIVVAVIDDGVDFSHPDLASRAWVNPGEAGPLATNGIDDDGNGLHRRCQRLGLLQRRRHGPRRRRGFARDPRRGHDRRVAQRHRRRRRRAGHQDHGRQVPRRLGGLRLRCDGARRDRLCRLVRRPDHQRLVGRTRCQSGPRPGDPGIECPVRGRRRQQRHEHRCRHGLLPRRLGRTERPDRRRDRPARQPAILLELRTDERRHRGARHEHPVDISRRLRLVRRHVDGGSPRRRRRGPGRERHRRSNRRRPC